MRVTHIGHAAILVESRGCRILSDPWWEGPCFGTQWWIYPLPDLAAVQNGSVDYVYISHGHHDHLHLGTLRRIAGSSKLLVSKAGGLAAGLREAGFEVIEIHPDEPLTLPTGIKADLRPTRNGDTLLVLDDGEQSCANLNDAVHSLGGADRTRIIAALKTAYPTLDYVFCGYGMASHFPACYSVPNLDRIATVAKRQAHFNQIWCDIVAGLSPRFGFPFAADIVFLEERLFWINEAVHNSERPTDRFHRRYVGHPTQVVDIAPGFSIANGHLVADKRFQPVDAERLRRERADGVAICARPPKLPDGALRHLADLLQRKIALCSDYLREFPGDYRAVIEIAEADEAILIAKRRDRVEAGLVRRAEAVARDITFQTKFGYLRRALTEEHGHEVLFVGSGCQFEYSSRDRLADKLHQEISVLLNARATAPRSRYGDQPKWLYQAKRGIKRLTGRLPRDPYALEDWLVFKQ